MLRAAALAGALALPVVVAAQMPDLPGYAPDEMYGRVVLDNFSTKAGVPSVTFDHWRHRAMYTCRVCHADVAFALKSGETQVSAATNRSGLHCGACHNAKTSYDGKAVFGACSESLTLQPGRACARCHTGASEDPRKRYDEFKKNLPTDEWGLIDWEAAERKGAIRPLDAVEGVSLNRPKMRLERDVPMIAIGTWLGNISFSHKKHTNWVGCELCHPDIFPLTQRGGVKFDMAKIRAGQYCGACHNTVAFPVAHCRRCHADQQRRLMR